jgi:hypothetical protein
VFWVWIRLQVAHLLALDTISRAFGSTNSKIPNVIFSPYNIPKRANSPWGNGRS